MKKLVFITMIISSSTKILFSQDNPKNIIKINPLSLIIGTYNGQFERVISKKQSVQIGISYTNFRWPDIGTGSEWDKGYIISFEYRQYILHKVAPRGCYVAMLLRDRNFKQNYDLVSSTIPLENDMINSLMVGEILGFQGIGKLISIDLFAGPAYVHTSKNGNFYTEGFTIIAGLVLGIAF